MTTTTLLLLLGFFGVLVILRVLGEKVLATLSREQKLTLVEEFDDLRRARTTLLFGLLVVVAAPVLLPSLSSTIIWVALGVFMVVYSGLGVVTVRRMRAHDLPARFVRFQATRTAIVVVGLAGYLTWLFLE